MAALTAQLAASGIMGPARERGTRSACSRQHLTAAPRRLCRRGPRARPRAARFHARPGPSSSAVRLRAGARSVVAAGSSDARGFSAPACAGGATDYRTPCRSGRRSAVVARGHRARLRARYPIRVAHQLPRLRALKRPEKAHRTVWATRWPATPPEGGARSSREERQSHSLDAPRPAGGWVWERCALPEDRGARSRVGKEGAAGDLGTPGGRATRGGCPSGRPGRCRSRRSRLPSGVEQADGDVAGQAGQRRADRLLALDVP